MTCPQCRQAFISPRLSAPDRDQIYADTGYFENGLYGDLAGRAIKEVWSRGRLNAIVAALGGEVANKRLLEIGCAYGFFLQAAQKLGFDVTGAEHSPAAVEWIKKNTRLNVCQGAIESAGLPPGHFDVVCLFDVIEHVENPPALLRTVIGLTRPGGTISLSCPNFGSLPARVFRAKWWTLRPQEHIWQFSPETLRRLLAETGLSNIAIRTSPVLKANLFRTDSMLAMARKPVTQ